MKTVDYTRGKKPNTSEGQEFHLSVTFRTGSKYGYYGATKGECEKKFKAKFGTYSGFVRKEWTIE